MDGDDMDRAQFAFAADAFGAYVSLGVVEHDPGGPDRILDEAYRVLAPAFEACRPRPRMLKIYRRICYSLTRAARSGNWGPHLRERFRDRDTCREWLWSRLGGEAPGNWRDDLYGLGIVVWFLGAWVWWSLRARMLQGLTDER
jgi:SAM-dependent methyltransferase